MDITLTMDRDALIAILDLCDDEVYRLRDSGYDVGCASYDYYAMLADVFRRKIGEDFS